MIYTLGHTESYLKYFEEQDCPKKKGRDENYEGGSVWETKEEALKCCPEDFSVFGVKADWEKDTVQSKNGCWHELLIDAELIKLGDGQ